MRVFLSIIANGLILFAIQYFLPEVIATGGWKLYFVGGVILGLLNTFVKPILKIFGFPFVIITLGLFGLVINGVILALLEKIIAVLNIAGVAFSTGSFANFAISVVLFTLFNTLYSAFFK
ncbi:MAG: phage holin family protein [Patescibacteria group bacterium]